MSFKRRYTSARTHRGAHIAVEESHSDYDRLRDVKMLVVWARLYCSVVSPNTDQTEQHADQKRRGGIVGRV